MSTALKVIEPSLPERMFAAWEQAAGQAADRSAADPRTLEIGSALMRSQLLVARAMGLLWEASLQPLMALTKAGRGL